MPSHQSARRDFNWWACSSCGFRMGYHPDDPDPTVTYCADTGQQEPVVRIDTPTGAVKA